MKVVVHLGWQLKTSFFLSCSVIFVHEIECRPQSNRIKEESCFFYFGGFMGFVEGWTTAVGRLVWKTPLCRLF